MLERAAIRHQQRTQEQAQAIQQRWDERKKKHALIKQEAQGILDKAKDYNEVDFSPLQNAIDSGDIDKMQSIAKEVEKGIAEIQEKQNNSKSIFPEEVYSQDRKKMVLYGVKVWKIPRTP